MEFLKIKSHDTALVGEDEKEKILTCIVGSRVSGAKSLFQYANINTGEINWVHAEDVKGIFSTKKTNVHKEK